MAPAPAEAPADYASLLSEIKQHIARERVRVVLASNAAFPNMKGFSPRNLKYMRAFAQAWQERPIVQEVLAPLTWYHNIALVEKSEAGHRRAVPVVRAPDSGAGVVAQRAGGADGVP